MRTSVNYEAADRLKALRNITLVAADSLHQDAAIEALRCLANVMLQVASARQKLVDQGSAVTLAERYKVRPPRLI